LVGKIRKMGLQAERKVAKGNWEKGPGRKKKDERCKDLKRERANTRGVEAK